MTANKMPEAALPEGVVMLDDAGFPTNYAHADYYTADQMRAMYLTALEDVRWELPVRLHGENEWTAGHNACRAATLTNLSALEQEAKK